MNITTYSSTFQYSDQAAKAQAHSTKPHQEGPPPAPWADLPHASLGPTTSTVQESYAIKAPIQDELSLDELKRSFLRKLRARRKAKEEEAYQAERARGRALMKQIENRYAPRETAVVFSHGGSEVRGVTHDALAAAERLDRLVQKERQRGAESQLSVARSSSSLDGPDPSRFQFLDPVQRQRLKYSLLEERRLAQFKDTLTSNGWATSTVPKAIAKTPLFPENKNSLTPEEQAKIEQRFVALKAISKETAEARAAVVAAIKEQQRSSASVDEGLREADLVRREQLRNGRSTPCLAGEDGGSLEAPLKPLRVEDPVRPEPVYRPELPLSKLPSRDVLESIAPFLDAPKSLVAPPWGRQTSLDDRWEKVRVFDSRSQSKKYETVGKLEVDHELKVVRDAGLLRKERQTLLKSLDPKTLEIVRSLPADYGRAHNGSKPMKQPTKLAAASLRP
jgi:hypothetical protein